MAEDKTAPARKTNVFISYSRKDAEAADRLHASLTAEGLNPYLDKHDIAAGEDWKARLGGLIDAADTMVFLISPDSIASSVCDWEINHAELMGKRILPVVVREAGDQVPERLRRLNYVFMRDAKEEAASLAPLAEAIAVDIAWIRNHTRYGELANAWDAVGRPARLLLRGASIAEAEQWRDQRPPTAPQLTEPQSAFIAASRRAAINRQRGWLAGSVAAAAVAIGLSVYAFFQQQAAETSRKETAQVLATSDLRQGTEMVDVADTAADGLAYLARAAESGDTRAQTRLWTMLQQRSFWLPDTGVSQSVGPGSAPFATSAPEIPSEIAERFANVDVNGTMTPTTNIAVSGDGKRVFTAVGDVVEGMQVMIRVWNADGTPYSDWWEPPYTGDVYLYRVAGFMNSDGRYLAVELEGWRETSYLVLYDMQEMKQLDGEIVASGLLPQTQSIGFSQVEFLEIPATADREARVLLLTAANKGDAAITEIYGDYFSEIALNRHRAAVTAISTDADVQWLMSAANDRSVLVSTLHTYEPIGNLVYADAIPTSLARPGASQLHVGSGGKLSAFTLKAPVRREPVPVAASDRPGAEQELCVRPTARFTDPTTALEHPSGLTLTVEEGRRVGVADKTGSKAVSSAFAADLVVVCASEDGKIVSVTTSDFRTELWKADFSSRLGPALNEKARFGEGVTPDITDWVAISADGTRALIRSSFWNPPNSELFWISAWDIASGLPLMDRVMLVNEGMSDAEPESARFTPEGDVTLIGTRDYHPTTYELTMPPELPAALPNYAEAIGGQSINAQGLAEAVPNRAELLDAGNRLIAALPAEKVPPQN